ncbi:gp184 [Bacillus phage G]|uniref:Gp184 n=1 Tax=Bacillus phage G TaxID=2884420 RepID=G3MBQ0_9CAUD|nr:gp184 [Bacillus phage G]AEO93444.1 gp184 [Bacillus phage G]
MTTGPFANSYEPTVIHTINSTTIGRKPVDDMWQNNGESNKYYEAQKRADMYAKLKERTPMVIEYKQTPDEWKSFTMYINPDRLSITNQKVKGKAYTRGGIFYHHWGDDNPILTLSGTTGFSGMKGIQTLEQIYHASGTLLKYQKFGPEKYAQRTNFQPPDVNLNSPVSVVEAAMNKTTTSLVEALKGFVEKDSAKKEKWEEYKNLQKQLEEAQKNSTNSVTDKLHIASINLKQRRLRETYGFPEGSYYNLSKTTLPNNEKETNNQKALSLVAINNYMALNKVGDILSKVRKAEEEVDKTVANNKTITSANNYKKIASTVFKNKLPGIDNELISQLASQKASYYKAGTEDIRILNGDSSPYSNLQDSPIPYREDLTGQMVQISQDRTAALESFMQDMAKLEETEKKYYEELRDNAFDDVMDDVNDEWKPRVIFIYFDNKAYMGHFDAFSYSQEAANPYYIRYEMRITITKEILSTKKENKIKKLT